MSLYARLIGLEDPKIEVHQFCAALAEQARLKITSAQVKAVFRLSVAEGDEFDSLFARVSLVASKEIEDVLELAEAGMFYRSAAEVKSRFGVLS